MLYIKDLAKKEGSCTTYYILQFFNQKELLEKYINNITFLSALSPKWNKYRITKIGRKYIYFIKHGKETKEIYNV